MQLSANTVAEVFISYSTHDLERITEIAERLQNADVSVWIDRNKIEGGEEWAAEIVRGIDGCKVVILMCSDASMRSIWVNREVQVAGQQNKPFLPLLLEKISYPDQMRLFLSAYQWIDMLNIPPEDWLPLVLRALHLMGVRCDHSLLPEAEKNEVRASRLVWSLGGLRSLAHFTDQIWPVPAHKIVRTEPPLPTRDLGAPQQNVEHGFRLGKRFCLAIENDNEGYLILLDEGPQGKLYSLCPSHFAPSTKLPKGLNYLPQVRSHYDSFVLTGEPGREYLLAIVTDEPLHLDWMPDDPKAPARILEEDDIRKLLMQLRNLPATSWTALASHFDVIE